ncbi:MAG: helix-turn-helix domain-containing protein [Planctomycetes bacterium]|nr:helix-turn-helix domain-containing protein [Planctomycetota bacterium]
MSIGAIVRQRREQLGLTQDEVAVLAGISKPYLSNIETGKAKHPPSDKVLADLEPALKLDCGELMKVAHMMATPADIRQEHESLIAEVRNLRQVLKEFLAGKKTGDELRSQLSPPDAQGNIRRIMVSSMVPIINRVSAGYPCHFTDLDYPTSVADEYIRCPDVTDSQAFGARVVGDSMEPDYREGDIVIFSPNTQVKNGDDCFVRFDAQASWGTTFKRYYQDEPEMIRLQPLNGKYPAETYPRRRITGLWPAVFKIQKLRV